MLLVSLVGGSRTRAAPEGRLWFWRGDRISSPGCRTHLARAPTVTRLSIKLQRCNAFISAITAKSVLDDGAHWHTVFVILALRWCHGYQARRPQRPQPAAPTTPVAGVTIGWPIPCHMRPRPLGNPDATRARAGFYNGSKRQRLLAPKENP